MSQSAASLAPQDAPLTRDQFLWRWRVLISTYCAYAGYYLCRKTFSICKTTLSKEFDVDLSVIAHIWTAYLVAYVIGQFVTSYLGRKWGPRILILAGLGISIAINIVFGLANSYWTFMVFMFFNGLVQATGWPACVGSVSEWIRRRERGWIMGIWSTNYVVGDLLVKAIGGYLLGAMGWRYAFFGCTLITFGIWWIIYFWQRTRPEDVGLQPIVAKKGEDQSLTASNEIHISTRDYLRLLLNPIVPIMGLAYFCLKFLRYALDSWLPTFLNLQGLDVTRAAWYSNIFTFAGISGAILAGFALDRWFRGRWDVLCLVMSLGMVAGYVCVLVWGANPYALAICFGLVGFMLYGPDTLMCGAAVVQVAWERNAVAVAGLVNGIASLGPVLQEEVIGTLIKGKTPEVAVRNSNLLAFGFSILLTIMLVGVVIQVNRNKARMAMSRS